MNGTFQGFPKNFPRVFQRTLMMLLSIRDVTFFMPMFPSYRNQSIDLHYKSINWFLYEGNIGMKKVKSAAPNLELFQQDNRQFV